MPSFRILLSYLLKVNELDKSDVLHGNGYVPRLNALYKKYIPQPPGPLTDSMSSHQLLTGPGVTTITRLARVRFTLHITKSSKESKYYETCRTTYIAT